jgi:hypothetical protein
MLFCLARLAATLQRHARRTSLLVVPDEVTPANVSLLVRPADIAILVVAE